MLFQRINRTDPEKVFIIVKAQEALSVGRPVCLHFTGTDDGLLGALCNAAADCTAVIGIANTNIAADEYGLVQVYGFRSDGKVSCGTTAAAGGNGAILSPNTGSTAGLLYMSASVGAATAVQPTFLLAASASAATTASTDASGSVGIFIRAM